MKNESTSERQFKNFIAPLGATKLQFTRFFDTTLKFRQGRWLPNLPLHLQD